MEMESPRTTKRKRKDARRSGGDECWISFDLERTKKGGLENPGRWIGRAAASFLFEKEE